MRQPGAIGRRRVGLGAFVLVFLTAPVIASGAGGDEPGTFHAGPLASRQVTPAGETRLRVLGPLFEFTTDEDGRRFWAVRPFFSNTVDPEAEKTVQDGLWPVFHRSTFRDESFWWFLTAVGMNRDIRDSDSQSRLWILPFFFQGRDRQGEDYWAVFPFGGSIHDFLGRDEIDFALWPLWIRSSVNYVETTDVLFPIFSRTEGKGIERWRVFPFYGQSKHRDRFFKQFILWPFWTRAEYYYEGSSGSGYILFPLFGRIDLEDQESWLVLPPFIRVQKGQRMNLVNAPWPFVQYASGEQEKLYLWPLWGSKEMHGTWSRFFLWPIFWRQHFDRGDAVTKRFLGLPFLYFDTTRPRGGGPAEGGDPDPDSLSRKIWPFFSYRAEEDAARFRLLDLWPLKQTPAIERNYAPLWTLYRWERVGEAREQELLWGLWHARRDAEGDQAMSLFPLFDRARSGDGEEASWSLLKGLIGWSREEERRTLQLLYFFDIPLGGRE